MRKIILSTAIAFAATAGALTLSNPANAANAPWCATAAEDDNAIDCSFQSRQQCEATVWGRGGQCEANAWSNDARAWSNAQARFIAPYESYARYGMSYEKNGEFNPHRP